MRREKGKEEIVKRRQAERRGGNKDGEVRGDECGETSKRGSSAGGKQNLRTTEEGCRQQNVNLCLIFATETSGADMDEGGEGRGREW